MTCSYCSVFLTEWQCFPTTRVNGLVTHILSAHTPAVNTVTANLKLPLLSHLIHWLQEVISLAQESRISVFLAQQYQVISVYDITCTVVCCDPVLKVEG